MSSSWSLSSDVLVYRLMNLRGFKLTMHLTVMICLVSNLQGQHIFNIDSLLQSVNHLENDSLKTDYIRSVAMDFRVSDPKKGIRIYEKLIEAPFYFVSDNNPKYDDYMLGELHFHANNFAQSEAYLLGYYDYWKARGGHENDLTAAKLKLSDLYLTKGNYEQAIEASLEVEDLAASADLTGMLVRAGAKTAAVMNKAGRTNEAISKLKALIPKALGKKVALSNVYNAISVIYDEHGPLDSAVVYMYKYKDLIFETGNFANQFIAIYNIAITEEKRGNLDTALELIEEAEIIAVKSGVPIFPAYVNLSKAAMLVAYNSLSEARELFDLAGKSDLLPAQKSMLYQGKYKLYSKQGKFAKALEYHERWKILEDSIRSEEIASKANEMEIRFDALKKEGQIQQLESEKTIQNQQIKMQKWGLLGLSLLVLILGNLFYIILRQRNKIKEQNLEIGKALSEKEVLLKEIHHRVKNNLQIISSLLSLQSRSVKDRKASNALEDGQSRVQSMALIHQHLYSGENITGVRVKNYLLDLCQNVFASHQINPEKVSLELKIEDIELDISTVVPLGLILNELITNSCKYAFPNDAECKISVDLFEEKDVLHVKVRDNGIGFQEEKVLGFGSKLIDSFVRKMDAELQSENLDGASIQLSIKNYKKTS